jgi:hypothetical protein
MSKIYKVTLTGMEVSILCALVASLDPAEYRHAEARSVIEKCKGIKDQSDDTLVRYTVLGGD